ncbi:MAG: hypothetical protein QME32_07600, partial [Endomicrobiia bacterium]|nr:hypothetical protein [Endomicrobiia bacterium]
MKDGTLYLAGKSQVTLTLESYCLDVDKAAPDKDEIYYLAPGPPKAIPLYKEILSYAAEHPGEQKQGFVQNLLWNVRNDVKFEDLSKAEQDFLLRVDKLAPLKINSRLKESLWKKLVKFVGKILPFSGSGIIPAIKGRPLSFQEYTEHIRNLSEKNVVQTPVKY